MLINTIKANKGELLYLFSQYTTPIIGFIVNIPVMAYIDPKLLGSYQSVILWSTYISFLQFGVFNGLNRNLSYYKGAGRHKDIELATSTGLIFSLIVSLVSLSVIICLLFTNINDGTKETKLAILVLGTFAICQPLITYFDTLFRTGQDFKKLGKIIFVENIFYLSLSIFIYLSGYIGIIIQNSLKNLLSLILRIISKTQNISIKFSFKSLKEQLTTGFPILTNGYLYSIFFIFDQYYIVNHFEKIELGYYNLARLVLLLVPMIPNSLTSVFYPKASNIFGQSNDKKNVLKPIFFKTLIINCVVIIPIILIIYFFISPIVNQFLPNYIEGIEYAKISVIGGIGFIYIGPSVILGVLKKNSLNFLFLISLTLFTYGLSFMGILQFKSIESLIWYKNILFIGYSILMLAYTYWQISKN